MVAPWTAAGFVVKRLGLEPFTQEELDTLCQASAPVAQKWAGVLLPYVPELTLVGALLYVLGPKVKKQLAQKNAAKELEKKRGPLSTPPVDVGPRGVQHARSRGPGDIPVLPEARLHEAPAKAPTVAPKAPEPPKAPEAPAEARRTRPAPPDASRSDIPILPEATLEGAPPVTS